MTNKKSSQFQSIKQSGGFGLVELMVAVAVGLVLLGAIAYVYLGSSQIFRTQDDFSRIQENVRYALETVGVDVRMAGYSGCVNVSSIDPIKPANPPPISVVAIGAPTVSLADAMRGYEGATWAAPGPAPGNWLPGTGVFHITRAAEAGVNLQQEMGDEDAPILINGNPARFEVGQALLISDCLRVDLFRASSVSPPVLGVVTIGHSTLCPNGMACNSSPELSQDYEINAEVYPLLSTTYFIGANEAGNPALYRRQEGGASQELVENVENIVMRFGIDTSMDLVVDSYVSAGAVTNWRQVLTVRLSLVFRGNSPNIATQVQPCVVENTPCPLPTNTADRRLRQVATATYGLRNRLP